MPKSLRSLTIAAQDELARVANLQEVLEICLEQFEDPSAKTLDRVYTMISLYVNAMSMHINHLESYLGRIRQHLVDEVDEA